MIANAVKFSADDGAVDVERWRDDQFAEIVVVDHGVGIKREFLLSQATTYKSQGSSHNPGACELVAVHAIQ